MKKDKLYRVNKSNQPLFAYGIDRNRKNIFGDGGIEFIDKPTELTADEMGEAPSYSSLAQQFGLTEQKQLGIPQYTGQQWLDAGASIDNKKGLSKGVTAGIKAGAPVAGGFIHKKIAGGYDDGGVGAGIASVGSAIGAAIPNPIVGAAVTIGANAIGGLYSRTFGSKMNKENIANIKNTIGSLKQSAGELAQARNNDTLIDTWSNSAKGFDFSNRYVGKDGWASNKAKKTARKLRREMNVADVSQMQGLATGAENADSSLDSRVMRQSFAYGGNLNNQLTKNTFDMGGPKKKRKGYYSEHWDEKAHGTETTVYPYGSNDIFVEMATPTDTLYQIHHGTVLNTEYGGKTKAGETPNYKDLRRKFYQAKSGTKKSYNVGLSELRDGIVDFIEGITPENINFQAYGGPIDTAMPMLIGNDGMGAIGYNFMSDYLTNYKNKQVSDSSKQNNLFSGVSDTFFANGGGIHIKESHEGIFTEQAKRAGMGVQEFAAHVLAHKNNYSPDTVKRANFARNAATWHALGGDIQTNSSDFTTGLMHIDAGNSHELNPNDGVQIGVDGEGKPNLVEEGETIFNDYVYSARIECDEETKRKLHLPKKAKITFAEASKKLEKESAERPNDPISKAAFKAQLSALAEQQERQKTEMEETRKREAFEALSPEEQDELLQYAQQREAMQQQDMQEQAMAEQAAIEQQSPEAMSPEEQAMMQQSQVQAAYGGEVNRYDDGGELAKRALAQSLGLYTANDLDKWLSDNDITGDIDYENLAGNEGLISALAKKSPVLAHAIREGKYDFGAYKPLSDSKATIKSISKGNWQAQDYEGWKDSEDPAWLEAVEKGLVKEGMNSKDIENALKQTDAYKKGSEWLRANEDNRLFYLKTLLENEDTPEVAKNYARKFIDENGWLKNADRSYDTIFGSNGKGVRETNPGTYWHTPIEAIRGKAVKNFVINDDGTIEEMLIDVPKDWKAENSYSWATADNDLTYNYYKRPKVASTDNTAKKDETEEVLPEIEPMLKDEWYRYAGLAKAPVELAMLAAGIGKPNTSGLNAAVDIASRNGSALADYRGLGNYLEYNPMDMWRQQNRMDANSRATDRALMNNSGPLGSQMAGLLANSYASQLGGAELAKASQEYNDALRKQTAEFNRGTDQFNADAFNRVSATNADIRNRDRQYRANLAMQAAQAKMEADSQWYGNYYKIADTLFNDLSALGKENAQHNMIARMAADGIFGNASDRTNVFKGYIQEKKSNGGKLKKKRRLGI